MNYQQFVRSKQMRASNRTRLYSQYRQEQVQEKLSQLGIFSYLDMQYAPRDTTAACDTLDVTMQATFAKPLDAELELNVVRRVMTRPVPVHLSVSLVTMYSEVVKAGT